MHKVITEYKEESQYHGLVIKIKNIYILTLIAIKEVNVHLISSLRGRLLFLYWSNVEPNRITLNGP